MKTAKKKVCFMDCGQMLRTLQATRLLTIASAASSIMDAWRAGLRLHDKPGVLDSYHKLTQ